jgi:HEAT repeats
MKSLPPSTRTTPLTNTTPVVFIIACILVTTGISQPVLANSQVEKLTAMLLDSRNHRVRAEAAYSLGKFPGEETNDALLNAMMDDNEGVRVAALSSLAKVGNAETIAVLRSTRDKNHVVRDQLHRTVVLLEERYPHARQPVDWKQVTGAIEIGALKDNTNSNDQRRMLGLRKYLTRHIRLQLGLAVAPPPEGLDKIKRVLKKNKIKPIFITVTLTSLEKSRSGGDVVWEARISTTVLNYPQKAIRAMIGNRAAIRRPLKLYRSNHDLSMQNRAIEEASRAAAENLAKKISEI